MSVRQGGLYQKLNIMNWLLLSNLTLMIPKKIKKKRFMALMIFLIAIVALPLLASLSVKGSDAWQIAANHGYASADGAAIVTTAVSAGAALELLCGIQLVAGILLAG